MLVKNLVEFFENVASSNKLEENRKISGNIRISNSEKNVGENEDILYGADGNCTLDGEIFNDFAPGDGGRNTNSFSKKKEFKKVKRLGSGRRRKRRNNSRKASFMRVKKIIEIIQKLLISEETYVYNLRVLSQTYIPYLEEYAPTSFLKKMSFVLTSAKKLCNAAENFVDILRQKKQNTDFVISVFTNSPLVFESYSAYICHISKIKSLISEAETILQDKLVEGLDKQSFASYLVSPLHRLDYYTDVLAAIKKIMKQLQHSTCSIDLAMTVIQTAKTKGHSLSAVNCIKLCPLELLDLGHFIMKDKFKISKTEKRHTTAFLFEKAIVFTEKILGKENLFAYVSYLNLNQIVLDKCPKQINTFCLLVDASDEGEAVTYSLKAATSEVKSNWILAIEARLISTH